MLLSLHVLRLSVDFLKKTTVPCISVWFIFSCFEVLECNSAV